ncbi:MAG TPA: site-2 protease family protein [Verrucomicrobiae bacterium]|nr:site-2 protease family protein [Verrucomicrobiae bacterium]
MKWSFKLGTFAGIGVYVHWTFMLLVGWIFFAHLSQGKDTAQAIAGVGFILALFVCVVLHEFGHALTARRYGVKTRDITLLPIGGVARLERIPEKPMQEFCVAIAGPAVNVVIVLILLGALVLLNNLNQLFQVEFLKGHFLARLMWLNVFLVVFNLLPAFPMDGGRVLRALLATRLGRRRATAIAANVGQGMAILFGIVGFLYNPFLIFIAIFVYLGAQAEAGMVEMQSALAGLTVGDAMMTRFRTLAAEDSLEAAIKELLASSQQDFPVIFDGQVIGVLRRNDLVKALSEGRRSAQVGDVMHRQCETVEASAPLTTALETMRERECASMPVVSHGGLVGLLTLENVSELVMVNAASKRADDKPMP